MKRSQPLGVALVGGGRIADLHAPFYLKSPLARLHALCDLDENVCRRRTVEWGLARTYSRFEDLLEDPEVDVVEILTPHDLHHPMTVAAARAGKHVSVQKPMATTVEECDEMIRTCRSSGVRLRVFENFVFHPPYVRARTLMEAGVIGEPLCARFHLGAGSGGWKVPLSAWLWRFDRERSGGGPTIFDDGFHKFSVAIDFFGAVESVTGWIGRSFGVVDSPAALAWRHKSGTLGYLDAALTPNLFVEGEYYPADERVEIVGSRGTIQIPHCTGRPVDGPGLIVSRKGRVEWHTDLPTDWRHSFAAACEDFLSAILEDRPARLTGERGREVTAFALAAAQAGEEHTTVELG